MAIPFSDSSLLKLSVSHSWQYQNYWNSAMLDGKKNLDIKHIQTTVFLCLESTNEAFVAVVWASLRLLLPHPGVFSFSVIISFIHYYYFF